MAESALDVKIREVFGEFAIDKALVKVPSLHGGTKRKEGAVIASALVGDAFRNSLAALKPLAWGKVGALLAGM